MLIGKKFKDLRTKCAVPISKFHTMIDLIDLPPKLADRAYAELAKQLRFHPDPEDMNEATRQAIVHGLLVTVCDYVVSEFDIPKESLVKPNCLRSRSTRKWPGATTTSRSMASSTSVS